MGRPLTRALAALVLALAAAPARAFPVGGTLALEGDYAWVRSSRAWAPDTIARDHPLVTGALLVGVTPRLVLRLTLGQDLVDLASVEPSPALVGRAGAMLRVAAAGRLSTYVAADAGLWSLGAQTAGEVRAGAGFLWHRGCFGAWAETVTALSLGGPLTLRGGLVVGIAVLAPSLW